MARLSFKARKKLPKRDFAVKSGGKGGRGKYPIEDASHARNALARVSQVGSPEQKKEVRGAVRRKFPAIGKRSAIKRRRRRR